MSSVFGRDGAESMCLLNVHCAAAQTLNVGSGSTVALAPRFALQAAAVVRANGQYRCQ